MKGLRASCFIFIASLLFTVFTTPAFLSAQATTWLDVNGIDFRNWQHQELPSDFFLIKNIKPEYVKDLEDFQKEMEEFDKFLDDNKNANPKDLIDKIIELEKKDKKEIVYDPKDRGSLIETEFSKGDPPGGHVLIVYSDPMRKKDILLWYIRFEKEEYYHNEFPPSKTFYMDSGKWVEIDEKVSELFTKTLTYFLYKKTGEFVVFKN